LLSFVYNATSLCINLLFIQNQSVFTFHFHFLRIIVLPFQKVNKVVCVLEYIECERMLKMRLELYERRRVYRSIYYNYTVHTRQMSHSHNKRNKFTTNAVQVGNTSNASNRQIIIMYTLHGGISIVW